MPLRDTKGRFCGTLHRKQADNNWQRNYFVLDEDKCLLRYFSIMNAKEEELDWDDYDGEINVRLITKIEDKSKSDDKSIPDGCIIEIQTCNERCYVRADTKEGAEEWIRTLRKAAVNPSKRQERRTEEAETANLSGEDQGKESTDDSKTEHVCYETKIIGGVVVRTPVTKVTDSDGESQSTDSLTRSGSAGATSTIKPIKEGYLIKKGAVVKNWKKRYFKLDFLKLAYYEKETDKEPIKVIYSTDIKDARKAPGVDNNREYLFEVVTSTRTFLFQGSTEEEMKSWIDAISKFASLRVRSSSEPEPQKVQEPTQTFQYAQTTTL